MRNNQKTIITAESTCDLSQDIISRLGIGMIPMYVNIGDISYKDGEDITPDIIYHNFEEKGILAKTSAIPVFDYVSFFQKYTEKGYYVIHLTLGAKFSSTYQAAVNAAEIVEHATVIDSQNLSTGYGHLVMKAAELAKEDKEPEEILNLMDEMIPKIRGSFIIDTLTYLHKGGRCSSVAALGANLLQLKPCIEVVHGEMKVGKKYRGALEKSLKNYVGDKLCDIEKVDPNRIFITHSGCSDDIIHQVKQQIEEKEHFKEIIVTSAGCTISCHCGPNTLGILYYIR